MGDVRGSVKARARLAGLLYLVIILGGLFAELGVRERLTVAGDAAATARNILEHETLYRLGFAAGLVMLMCAVPLALILYELLKRVSRSLARLAIFFNAISIAIEAVNALFHYAPLVFLSGGSYLGSIPPEQLQSLAYVSLRLQSVGYNLSLAFFAWFCIFIGIVIARSTFLPRLLGWLMALAGVCYLINSFAAFLAPPLSSRLFPYILLPCLVGEAGLCLWLLVAGVNARRWEEQGAA